MTKIQNPKQVAIDLIWDLEFIWPNFKIRWYLQFVISRLSELGICSFNFGVNGCPPGAYFSEPSLGKNLVPIYLNHIMFAHDLCHSQIEYFRLRLDSVP